LRLEAHANGTSDGVTKDEPAPKHLDDIDTELAADLQRG
jgi:hypothetical protein